MNKNWENCYIGLPYKLGGRERNGIDCWGLVRLIHKEQLGIDLPSFAEVISLEDQAETISREKEGWIPVVIEQTGDVVLFNILGNPTHVGVITKPGFFIHAFENQDVRIERLDDPKWKRRIQGIYRYNSEFKGANLIGLAHPLKTERIDTIVEAGKTLEELHVKMKDLAKVSDEYESTAAIYVDSVLIPRDKWKDTVVKNGQRVEYRATVQGGGGGLGGIFKVVASIAISYFSAGLATALYSAIGGTFVMANAGMIISGLSIGINVLGGVLLNAIFPTRPPQNTSQSYTNETGDPSYFLQGGTNQSNKFGAIPVVLGTMRYTPPLAAETYAEAEDVNSYLRMVLCWGYGPLQVSNITIGDEQLSNFSDIQIETIGGFGNEDFTKFNSLYGQDVEQQRVAVELTDTSTWVTRTLDEEVDQLSFMFEYPNGLYRMNESDGSKSNNQSGIAIQYRPIGSSTWLSSSQTVSAASFELKPSYNIEYVVTDDSGTTTVSSTMYQWSSIIVDASSNLVIKHGTPVATINGNPSALPSQIRQQLGLSYNASESRLPNISGNEVELYRICTSNGAVVATETVTSAASGCVLSTSGLTASITSGATTAGAYGDVYLDKKALSPFIKTQTYNVPRAKYEVRVRRTIDGYSSYDAYRVVFSAITGYKNTKPIAFNKPLAMSAIRIKSSNQFNGQVDGFIGTVSSLCLKWNGTSWVYGTTSNPAALYRYVLQHMANAKPLPDSKIDLVAIQEWYEYCNANGFQYNALITDQRSLYEVLKDICAAGRASPTRYNGKWSVIVDKPRNSIIQHFTPHNSWGFEGTKNLPKLPHAFKVSFINEEKTYQPDELFVYNDGYNESNATLFEGLELPGVTNPTVAYKHARFHLAQLKLRPEVYSLNVDIEHIVCNRGDLVRVTHDTPLWGLGSGRIKSKVSSTELLLDEPVPMKAGLQYTVRIRNQDGSSVVKTILAKTEDAYYDSITLSSELSSTQGISGDLFLFGELGSESVDLIVLSIEPSGNLTAKITLVDYSPEVYYSDIQPVPTFNSKVTLAPGLLRKRITEIPNIKVQSGDYAILEVSPGVFQYGINISWDTNPSTANKISYVEVQIDLADDNTTDWLTSKKASITEGSITFNQDIRVGEVYTVRARYVNDSDMTGKWSDEVTHEVQGRNAKPLNVEDFMINNNLFTWKNQTTPGIAGYRIKYNYGENTSWTTATELTTVLSSPYSAAFLPEGVVTFLIKAVDTLGNESNVATSIIKNLGDNIVSNVVETYDYRSEGYPGSITGGSIVDTSIVADTITGGFSEVEWISQKYSPTPEILIGSNMTLDYSFSGNSPKIWFRNEPTTVFYQSNTSTFYGTDSSYFYEAITDWQQWYGVLATEDTAYQFKFSDISGVSQGKLDSFKVVIDAPDKILRLNDITISPSGTRLTDAIGYFTSIKNVQLTLQSSSANMLYVEDKDPLLGPMIRAKLDGVGVSAIVDVVLQGY